MEKTLTKRIDIESAHFRIGWQESLENLNWDKPSVRYYPLSVTHDRIETQARMSLFLEQIPPVEEIAIKRGIFEKMGRTEAGLYYFFKIVDSPVKIAEVNFGRIGRNIIRDRRLCEREVGNILDYLNTIYHFR